MEREGQGGRAAAISVRQVKEVLALIHRPKDTGHAVILVSPRMPDMFDICDRVAAPRRGIKVADKRTSDTTSGYPMSCGS